MKDYQTHVGISCAKTRPNARLSEELATDKAKREMFDRLRGIWIN